MPDPTNDNQIDALMEFLQDGSDFGCECGSETAKMHLSALTALVAERNALRERVAELESQPPTSDLRERLVCAALTGVMAHPSTVGNPKDLAEIAVAHADAAIAAMRKGDTNA